MTFKWQFSGGSAANLCVEGELHELHGFCEDALCPPSLHHPDAAVRHGLHVVPHLLLGLPHHVVDTELGVPQGGEVYVVPFLSHTHNHNIPMSIKKFIVYQSY